GSTEPRAASTSLADAAMAWGSWLVSILGAAGSRDLLDMLPHSTAARGWFGGGCLGPAPGGPGPVGPLVALKPPSLPAAFPPGSRDISQLCPPGRLPMRGKGLHPLS